MRSWAKVDVPRIPGGVPELRLWDTRSAALVTSAPETTARLYVCGITPYDATHLGHAATYLVFDLLCRQWLDRGVRVHYVQNVTDVDEPLLERAAATGDDWSTLAEREIDLFRSDMTALRMLPPRRLCGVVESVDQIAAFVSQLGDSVYRVGDDLYFDVRADPDFGSIARLDEATMRQLSAERGGDPDRPGKRDALDPMVWRAPVVGEPHWASAVGDGRPGWHVECAAICVDQLGPSVDVMGGGSDLVFPHHECGASQVRVAGRGEAAQAYLHTAMVAYHGEKMSKSLGNLVLVSALVQAGHDPAAIRLALLAHQHGHDWEWTDAELVTATVRLARWRDAVARATTPHAQALIDALRAALANNLDAPAALAAVDAWCAHGGDDATGGAAVSAAVDALLGVRL